MNEKDFLKGWARLVFFGLAGFCFNLLLLRGGGLKTKRKTKGQMYVSKRISERHSQPGVQRKARAKRQAKKELHNPTPGVVVPSL